MSPNSPVESSNSSLISGMNNRKPLRAGPKATAVARKPAKANRRAAPGDYVLGSWSTS